MDPLFLPVVAQLNSGAVKDATEGHGLDLPVRHGVAEQTNARIHGLLGVEAGRAEVFCSHRGYLVGVKIDHLPVQETTQVYQLLSRRAV